MSLVGKAAIITGGGRGIGRAIALAFSEAGASVGLIARSADQIEAVASEIRSADGTAFHVAADVTDPASIENAVDQLVADLGRLDVLVNNAGGGTERKKMGEDDPLQWKAVVEVNLLGTYFATRAAVRHLRDAGGGSVINVGSGMGHEARPGNSSYNAAKAGVWMLTRCLALELWSDQICINELIPGPVETELTADLFVAGQPHPSIPSEWVKSPHEVAPLAVFLAEQSRQGPTGQSFSLARRPV